MTDLELTDLEIVKKRAREIVGKQINYWLVRNGMDKFDLAKKAGMHHDTVYRILRGDRGANIDSLAAMAYAFDIPLLQLLTPVE